MDLTGRVFGRLTVLGRLEDHITKSGTKIAKWRCRCVCGTILDVRGPDLRTGDTKSCGCYKRDVAPTLRIHDLTGQRFGRLVVLARAETYIRPQGGRSTKWFCQCDCGQTTTVLGGSLQRGGTQSCGCYMRETNSERSLIDLTGNTYGRLTVVSRAADYWQPNCKQRMVRWLCLCSCGAQCIVVGAVLKSGHTRSCGCYKRDIISERHLGSNSYFWKGGISTLTNRIRTSTKYRDWRTAIFARDNHTCQFSQAKGGKLQAHHIKPFGAILSENGVDTWEAACECRELWDINNGITLAKEWHSQTSKQEYSFHRVYGTDATELDFYTWFETRPHQKGNYVG